MDPRHRILEEPGQHPSRNRRRRSRIPLRRLRAIETHQRMEMHHAPRLVLRDLRVLQGRHLPQPRVRHTQSTSDDPTSRDREPPPQLRSPPLPDRVPHVVVAVRADRRPHVEVTVLVRPPARHRTTVLAHPVPITRTAPLPSLRRMHRTEGRSRQRQEDQRIAADLLRHALAPDHTGPDHLEGVPRIDPRAGRAHTRPPIAAPHIGHAEGLVSRRIAAQHLTRGPVDATGGPDQPDRVRAMADPRRSIRPGIEGAAHEAIHHALPSSRPEAPQIQRRIVAVAGEPEGGAAVIHQKSPAAPLAHTQSRHTR